MTYKYEQPTQDLVSVYEYFESKGYTVKVTDVEDGTVIFIKEKKQWVFLLNKKEREESILDGIIRIIIYLGD